MQKCTKEMSGSVSEKVDRSNDYDVVVIGGAFSGSSSAILIKRRFPDLKVLIVEKSEIFDRKVGESTSEVSACFLTRVLKVGRHLAQQHVNKQGLRMWFHREGDNDPGCSTEVGPAYQSRLPTFQLNRLKLDTHLLEEAEQLGCVLVRPATIKNLELGGAGKNKVVYKTSDGETHEVTAGWVVDASGKASLIARKMKMWHSNADQHPVNAMWTRFKNFNDLDSVESVEAMGGLSTEVFAQRGVATNHLMGYGWWSWIIPLDSGEVSVGLTWDERIFTPPKDGSMSERLKEHLLKHPIGNLMFKDSVAVENDNRYYKGLPYYSDKIAGDGWTIAGDSAGFMDPLYSQGLDFCAHTIYSSYDLMRTHFNGECIKGSLMEREGEYKKSYFYWFNALYKDKYYYIGDAELTFVAFLLDIATYFIGPVRGVYENQDAQFTKMPYDGVAGSIFAKFMSFYNRRLVCLARKKIKVGKYGDKNLDHRFLSFNAFTPGPPVLKLMFQGIKIWLWAELRYVFVRSSMTASEATTMTPLPQAGDYKQA